MERPEENATEVVSGTRRFKSPHRILVRSFRLSRDKWKKKHHVVQAELEQVRQLAAERGASRDLWQVRCEAAVARAAAAESLAAQRLSELESVRVRLAEPEATAPKKKTR